MLKRLIALSALLLLTSCGGGDSPSASSGSTTTTTTTSPTLTNLTTVTVDAGPAVLNTGPDAYIQDNVAYVSVTLCAPGTSNCQTIDHVQLDTGSVGLRIVGSVLNASLLSALPTQKDASGNAVGECFGYVDGYVFGSVRVADFQIGGESVASMPLQVIGDGGAFAAVPTSCSSGGGTNLNTVSLLGANGIIGIGVTTTDCGSLCAVAGGYSAAEYYDCPGSGCFNLIARSAVTTAPFQQLPNPVAAMTVDNNGTILTLPSAPGSGETSMTGTLYFGIGTQTNNGIGSATILTTTGSAATNGAGLVTASYKGQMLNESYLDSGTNLYVFNDSAITVCSSAEFAGYYCPNSSLSLTPSLTGQNGVTASANFALNNAQTLLSTTFSVLPGVGSNTNGFSNAYSNSFAFGLPFFFGRSVYTALEGRTAAGTVGPYLAY